jgi:GntR family transcriptional regulator
MISGEMRPIDHHSPVPYYYQLADILREAIERGTWQVGELIPAEGALTEMFGISRSVTRKALDLLEGEGRVLRVKGKGTLVVGPKFAYEAIGAAGDWFAPRTHPLRLGKVVTAGRSAAGGNLGKLLGLSPRDQVWEIALTHDLDNTPVALSHMYLRIQGTLTVSAPPEFEPGGPDIIQQLAAKYGVEIVNSQIEIEVAGASATEAEHLEVKPATPVVQVSSLDLDRAGRVVGFTRTAFRAEHFFFAADLRRRSGSEVAPTKASTGALVAKASA